MPVAKQKQHRIDRLATLLPAPALARLPATLAAQDLLITGARGSEVVADKR